MGKYFGTDGFRGEANVNLTVEHAYQVGRFLGWYYGKDKEEKCKVVIGKDTRRSSYMFEYSLVAGLTASGADVYLLHVTTTPSVSYVVRTEDFDCGIMISASHNPYYDNGIKLINSKGEKMDEETILKVEDYIDGKLEIPMAVRDQIGCTVDYSAGRNRYIGYLISLATRSYKNMKVGLDCANGSSWMIARSVFDALGAKTYVINAQPDGLNINMNAGSTHIEVLQKFVKENQLDVGFAFDGDADRCIAVDENGSVVDGDLILYVYGRYLKEKGELRNNTVVTTIMSNFGLYKAFDELGVDYEKTQVGDKYVYENMVQNGHRIGGEQSGHIIFSKYATTGDGILTAIKMMEVMLEKKQSLATLTSPVRIYPQVLKNVRVKSKPEAQNDADVQAAVKQVAETLGATGRILVRESGTEPVIRVMVEAETKEECEKYVDSVIEVIEKLKRDGIKIGSTTGYTTAMMDIVLPGAAAHGYITDNCVTSNNLPAGRPQPYMIYQNMIDLAIPSVQSVIKYGDTIADIKEGVNAGVWTVGVILGSNEMGLTQEETGKLPAEELNRRMAAVRKRMYMAGAHYVVNTIAELPEIIEIINHKMN